MTDAGAFEMEYLSPMRIDARLFAQRFDECTISLDQLKASQLTAEQIQERENRITALDTAYRNLKAGLGDDLDAATQRLVDQCDVAYDAVKQDESVTKLSEIKEFVTSHVNCFRDYMGDQNRPENTPHMKKYLHQYIYLLVCSTQIGIMGGIMSTKWINGTVQAVIFYLAMGISVVALTTTGYLLKKLRYMMPLYVTFAIFTFCTSLHFKERKEDQNKVVQCNCTSTSNYTTLGKRDYGQVYLNEALEYNSNNSTYVLPIFLMMAVMIFCMCWYFFFKKKSRNPVVSQDMSTVQSKMLRGNCYLVIAAFT